MGAKPTRVYRAEAHYSDGSAVGRNFLTKRARDRWVRDRLQGYPADTEFDMDRPAIPPARWVWSGQSEPVVWR